MSKHGSCPGALRIGSTAPERFSLATRPGCKPEVRFASLVPDRLRAAPRAKEDADAEA